CASDVRCTSARASMAEAALLGPLPTPITNSFRAYRGSLPSTHAGGAASAAPSMAIPTKTAPASKLRILSMSSPLLQASNADDLVLAGFEVDRNLLRPTHRPTGCGVETDFDLVMAGGEPHASDPDVRRQGRPGTAVCIL